MTSKIFEGYRSSNWKHYISAANVHSRTNISFYLSELNQLYHSQDDEPQSKSLVSSDIIKF